MDEIATKKKLAGSLKKKSFVRPRYEFAVKKWFKTKPKEKQRNKMSTSFLHNP